MAGRSKPFMAVFTLIVLLRASLPDSAQADEDRKLIGRILKEFPPALERLKSSLTNINGGGSYIRTVGPLPGDKVMEKYTFEFQQRATKRTFRRVWEKENQKGLAAEMVRCSNPGRYTFTAVRRESGSPMIVRELGDDIASFNVNYNLLVERFAYSSFMIFGIPISAILNDPSFKIRTASTRTESGRERVQERFCAFCWFLENVNPGSRVFLVECGSVWAI